LAIDDLVEELTSKWHEVVSSEVMQHQQSEVGQVYPEVYSIDPYSGEMRKTVYTAQHHAVRQRPWHPDVSFILTNVIEAVKQHSATSNDVNMAIQLLEFDIASMTHHQLLPNIPADAMEMVYTDTRMKVAKLAANFGRRFFQRLIEFGMYKEGYFPYHFAGWMDSCVLVALDDSHNPGVGAPPVFRNEEDN
jgi:hypothetical protein